LTNLLKAHERQQQAGVGRPPDNYGTYESALFEYTLPRMSINTHSISNRLTEQLTIIKL